MRGRGRRLRGPGRTRSGHRHRGWSRHRADAWQQPSGLGPGGRDVRPRLRGGQGVRAARARRDRARRRPAPGGHGPAQDGPLLPGDLRLRRRGHAGRDRAGADRRSAVPGAGRQGSRLRSRQDRRPARGVLGRPRRHQGAGLARVVRGHDRGAVAVEARAGQGADGARAGGRGRPRHGGGVRTRPARGHGGGAGPVGFGAAPSARHVRRAGGRRGARDGRRVHADRLGRVAVQRGRGGPAAFGAAHSVRPGAARSGRRQHRVRAVGRTTDDRGDRAQRGQRPGRRPHEGIACAARGVAAAVRGAAAGRTRLPPDPGARGHPDPFGCQARPGPAAGRAVARTPGRGARPLRDGRRHRRGQHVRGRADRPRPVGGQGGLGGLLHRAEGRGLRHGPGGRPVVGQRDLPAAAEAAGQPGVAASGPPGPLGPVRAPPPRPRLPYVPGKLGGAAQRGGDGTGADDEGRVTLRR
ncbi:hypothetical protein SGPA1_40132 [Streptomyces misionensis JCM 4497]